MKPEEKVIMYESDEAATFVTDIKGWIDKDRRFYGNMEGSEHMARWSSCTHKKCECGNITKKGWLKCDDCRHKDEVEKYNAKPFKKWNESDYVYSDSAGRYFRDVDELNEYLDDNEEVKPSELRLILCEPNRFNNLNADYFSDDLPEDVEELPKELQDAIDNLNKVIDSLPPASYSPGKYRTEYILEI
jgi:hypothetical protein